MLLGNICYDIIGYLNNVWHAHEINKNKNKQSNIEDAPSSLFF